MGYHTVWHNNLQRLHSLPERFPLDWQPPSSLLRASPSRRSKLIIDRSAQKQQQQPGCDTRPIRLESVLRLGGCCTGTMEQKLPKPGGSSRGQESMSYQRRMWKNFQEKTKPWLSPKLGSERRGAGGGAEGTKKESGLWMFKRKRKPLDRVFSSSQPNLCSSTPAPFEGDKPPAGGSDATSDRSSDGQTLGTVSGATGSKPELSAHGSPKVPPMSQLIVYQQKSSSLGSACFEKLVVEPTAELEEEEQLRKNASDSVSKEPYSDTVNVRCHTLQPCKAVLNIKAPKWAWLDLIYSWMLSKGDKFDGDDNDNGAAAFLWLCHVMSSLILFTSFQCVVLDYIGWTCTTVRPTPISTANYLLQFVLPFLLRFYHHNHSNPSAIWLSFTMADCPLV